MRVMKGARVHGRGPLSHRSRRRCRCPGRSRCCRRRRRAALARPWGMPACCPLHHSPALYHIFRVCYDPIPSTTSCYWPREISRCNATASSANLRKSAYNASIWQIFGWTKFARCKMDYRDVRLLACKGAVTAAQSDIDVEICAGGAGPAKIFPGLGFWGLAR